SHKVALVELCGATFQLPMSIAHTAALPTNARRIISSADRNVRRVWQQRQLGVKVADHGLLSDGCIVYCNSRKTIDVAKDKISMISNVSWYPSAPTESSRGLLPGVPHLQPVASPRNNGRLPEPWFVVLEPIPQLLCVEVQWPYVAALLGRIAG